VARQRLAGAFVTALAELDAAGTRRLLAARHKLLGDALLVAASDACEHGRLWLACCAAGAVVDGRSRGAWLEAGAAVAASEIASQSIKRVLRRPRPEFEGLPPLAATPSLYSFPSAHTAAAVAAARTFPRAPRTVWAAAVTMAISRPYLGVHYPSDVIAGAMLGYAIARAATARRRRAG
jgi:membrane-associated phospholipid phosphatase